MAAVDCSDSANHELCRRFEVMSFPTIKLFPPSLTDPEQLSHQAETYEGARTAHGMAGVIRSLVSAEKIHSLKADEAWEAPNADSTHVLLFTEKTESTLLYRSLSWKYHFFATFHEIPSTHPMLKETFKITKFPTLLVLKRGETVEYSGSLGAADLNGFLDRVLEVPSVGPEFVTELHFLTSSDLDRVDTDEEIWLIAAFTDPKGTGCSESIMEFDEVAKRVREMVRVGFYNLTAQPSHPHLQDMDLDPNSPPCKLTVVRCPFGTKKNEMDEYEIYTRALTSKSLQSFALEANEIHPLKLDAKMMLPFMGVKEGHAPRPKVLLFSSFEACPPLFAALAMAMRHWKADFAYIPPSEPTLRDDFQIQSLPTLSVVYFDPTAEEGKQVLAPQYPGPLRFSAMKGWIEALLITLKTDKTEVHDPFFAAEEKTEVPKIESDADLEAVCNEAVPLCVFVVLDEAHSAFQSHLEWLQTFVLQKQSQQTSAFSFAWISVSDAENFISVLGVGKGDVPGIIVLSPTKLRYATLKRQSRTVEVDAFLSAVMQGRERTYTIESIPRLKMEEEMEDMEEEIDLGELEDIQVGTKDEL